MKRENLRFATKYGGFSEDGKQYVVVSPDTPRDWANILTNRTFHAVARTSGQGYSFRLSPAINQVTTEGRAFYVRDRESGEYWSPTGWPTRRAIKKFRCVHSPSSTTHVSEYAGIGVTLQTFVPMEGDVQLWRVTLENRSSRKRKLSLFSVIPWQLTNGSWAARHYNYTEYRDDLDGITAHTAFLRSPPGMKYLGLFASSPAPVAFDGGEEAFRGGSRGHDRPLAVEQGRLTGSIGRGEALIGALQNDVTLAPGQSRDVILMVAIGNEMRDLKSNVRRFLSPAAYGRELGKVEAFWKQSLAVLPIETPDAEANLLANIWVKRQLVYQILTQRSEYGNYSGRNSLQDAIGFLPFDPAPCRERILDACRYQYPSGFVPLDWPTTPQLNMAGTSKHMDCGIWSALALAAYLDETADDGLLDKVVPYRGGPEKDTVLDHTIANLRHLSAARGTHGLILFGGGDWNDPLEAPGAGGKGESTWTTLALIWALRRIAPHLRRVGQKATAAEFERNADKLAKAVNARCWTGRWYNRGFTDAGRAFGVPSEKEGRIYINPQTWAVISGTADEARGRKTMAAVEQLLETECGAVLLAPYFTKLQTDLGRITQKVTGHAENGSVYNHAAMFKIFANCLLGQGDVAYASLRKSFPTVRQHPVDVTRHIGMWMPNYYEPPNCPTGNRASFLYLTGTVPWFIHLLSDWIIGVRASYEGLKVAPCLPRRWKTCRLVRKFRGGEYDITVRNPHGLETGRVSIVCDGDPVAGNILPVKKGKHRVEVTLHRE